MLIKKTLLISYAFPPLSAPESFLSAKTLKDLPGFQVDVITATPHQGILPFDPSLDTYVKASYAKVFKISVPLWVQLLNRISPLRRALAFLSIFPDKAVYLNRAAYQRALALGLGSYDSIITWSQFHSSHLVGLKIKKKNPQMKWIAHFSDPWADNPFNRMKWLTGFLYRRLERQVISKADRLVFTSQLTVDLVLKKYPKEFIKKVSVIPHPFDETLYEARKKEPHAKFIFRYLGKFYGKRNPKTLLQALEIIGKTHPEALKKVRFEFTGGDYSLRHALPDGVVEFLPGVNYLASLQLMQSADVLLIIDAPAEQTVFLPSKLVDYLGAERPIFGITPRGTSQELIEELGWRCVEPTDPKKIAQALLKLIEDLGNGWLTDKRESVQEVRNRYKSATVRRQMVDLLS